MHARHGQRGDVHGDTPVQVKCPDDEEEPTAHDRPGGGERDRDRGLTFFYTFQLKCKYFKMQVRGKKEEKEEVKFRERAYGRDNMAIERERKGDRKRKKGAWR